MQSPSFSLSLSAHGRSFFVPRSFAFFAFFRLRARAFEHVAWDSFSCIGHDREVLASYLLWRFHAWLTLLSGFLCPFRSLATRTDAPTPNFLSLSLDIHLFIQQLPALDRRLCYVRHSAQVRTKKILKMSIVISELCRCFVRRMT